MQIMDTKMNNENQRKSDPIDRSLAADGEFVAKTGSGSERLPSAGVDVEDVPAPAPENGIQKCCLVCGQNCSVIAGSGLYGVPLTEEMIKLVQLHLNTSLKETDATKKEVGLCNLCCTNLQTWTHFYMNTRIKRNRSLLPSSAVLSNGKYCVICFGIRKALPFGQREGEMIFTNYSSTETPQWKLTTEMALLIAQLHIQVEWNDKFGIACLSCLGVLRAWLSWKLQHLRRELLAPHVVDLRSAELNLTASQQQNRGLKRKREAEPTEVEVVDIE